MQCYSPLSIPRPKGQGNADRITVPCGKCVACLSNHRSQWSFRLNQELKVSSSATFITFTYDDGNLPLNEFGNDTLVKIDIQLFLKRLRQQLVRQNPKVSKNALKVPSLRYYIVGEYGSKTMRPHYHAIMFNLPVMGDIPLIELLKKSWTQGFVSIGKVEPASINYVTKYLITKNENYADRAKPFSLMSSKPGLGSNYLNDAKKWHHKTQNYYSLAPGGTKVALPRYYRDKIFTKLEKLINTEKQVVLSDHVANVEHERSGSLGNNPYAYELMQKIQKEFELKKKLSKLDKL